VAVCRPSTGRQAVTLCGGQDPDAALPRAAQWVLRLGAESWGLGICNRLAVECRYRRRCRGTLPMPGSMHEAVYHTGRASSRCRGRKSGPEQIIEGHVCAESHGSGRLREMPARKVSIGALSFRRSLPQGDPFPRSPFRNAGSLSDHVSWMWDMRVGLPSWGCSPALDLTLYTYS
jgi:hypothetical protein